MTLELALSEANEMEQWGRLLRSKEGAVLLARAQARLNSIRRLYARIDVQARGALELLANFQGREEELLALVAGVDEETMAKREKVLASRIEMCRLELQNRNQLRESQRLRGDGILPEELRDVKDARTTAS